MIRRVMVLSVVAVLLPVAELSAQQESDAGPSVLEVTALDYSFQSSASEIPAGWTTIRLHNRGKKTHSMEIARLPDGVSHKEVGQAFATYDSIVSGVEAGSIDTATGVQLMKEEVPKWFSPPDWEYKAGPGLSAPGQTSTTTVRMEPGQYIMACSVKNSEGKQHFRLGMIRPLTVTPKGTSDSPPEANVTLRLSHYDIETEGEIGLGKQTIAVEFGERSQQMEEPLQDIHLARLGSETDLQRVMEWVRSRETPAPTEFLGGATVQPAGDTVYITVDLSAGRYAWVSLASEPKGMVEEFTVEP